MKAKEKKKQQKQETQSASFFKELGCFMKPYNGKYALSVVISILSVGAGLAAYAFAGMTAAVLFRTSGSFSEALRPALLAALCKLINAVFLNWSTWVSHRAAYFTLQDIRTAVSEKMLRLPMGYFEQNGSGRLKSLLVDHIESMEKTLAHMIPELTANLLGPLLLILWMFFIDWRLSLIALIWIILGFSVTGGMMKGYEEKYAGQLNAAKTMNQAVVEYADGIEVVKNFGRADDCYAKYTDAVYGHADYNLNWMKETQVYSGLGMAVAPFSLFPVLLAGVWFYSRGTLTATDFFMMLLLTLGIFKPLMQAMTYFDQIAQMGTDAKEIRGVLDHPDLKRAETGAPKGNDVVFSDVSFSYEKDAEPVLKHISLSVPAGTMLALVGPSGSGKSTIAKLLAGYWDADKGSISVGGKPLTECSQEELNKAIAYVEQETFLFDTTILENIRMGNRNASDADVMEAAEKAGCDAFIRALPNGYQTQAGEAGGRLSGGERQRIAIARAMLKNAPILILDEATASSDPENEASIQAALSAAAKGKTLIVVAHRLATIQHAEQIAFIQNGTVLAVGSHKKMLENCGEYAAMWNASEVK